ncbi:MAG TPA: TonB-dependent receptor [Terriglobales bacterium]|jgi:Carboxypeptidase regulatory-like domain/TonB dependent receptor|nr:TonB-dependent receptor [Terriglobales bacterium]
MKLIHSISLGLMLVTLLATAAFAQTQLGQISGKVIDPNQAVVVDAKVLITNISTGIQDIVQTNAEGLFTLGNVAVGDYEVSIEKQGFKKVVQHIKVEVAQRVGLTINLEVGSVSETVEVTAGAVAVVNTQSAEVSREITSNEVSNLPLLNRNPYVLVSLAPGAVDAAKATGDEQGVGIAIAGSRNRSINFLLDGSENNETFSTGPSTLVPVDAISEFRVQTNSMTAEFGRNSLQANVATKSGTNAIHGSLSEFYRGSALSSQPVEEKVNDLPKGRFVRNVFGASLGGPIIKDKTFYFGAFEGTRVRSTGRNFYYVPTQQFFDNASTNMQDYLQAGGGVPQPLLPDVLTPIDILIAEGAITDASQYNTGLNTDGIPTALFTSGTTNAIAADTPLYQRTYTSVPIDAGGGLAQDAWSVFGRVDHQFSDRTNLGGRWAWYRRLSPVGSGSDSPFSEFNTESNFRSQNASLVLTHAFSAQLFNETRVGYSRTIPDAPLGQGDPNVMCFTYGFSGSIGTGDQMVGPGYLPASCYGFAIPSGGPQNTYSAYSGFTWSKGRHIWKWGAYGRHLRDNHTFGAFENAYGQSSDMQNYLDGVSDADFRLAFNPKGKVPGETYTIATDGPVVAPSFTRHYHYNEFALYFEDQFKILPRVSLTAGMRWEYFGVLHSPNAERFLDANLFLDAVGSPTALTPGKTVFEQVRDARFARTGNLFNQDFNNFAPRVGIAWDMFGNSRTVLRAGYGVYYDANFGNALFNVIQNPPNYAVAIAPGGHVYPNQYDTLTEALGASAGSFTYTSSARMLNRDMVTAYSQQWNATIEHDVFGKGIFASIGYVGSKGDKLYSLNNLNQRGSCIFLDSCGSGSIGSPYNRLNTGVTGMNRRGNEGFSRYHSMQLQVRTKEIAHTGLQLNANYTWARSIDNSTSFFNDSSFDSNGDFGFSNPYNPRADKASSSNDIHHRLAINYSWEVPWTRNMKGISGTLLGGWTVTGIYTAQTGGAFSVYEDLGVFDDACSVSAANGCYPVVTGALPGQQSSWIDAGPNRTVLYDFSNSLTSLSDYCNVPARLADHSNDAAVEAGRACTQELYYFPPNGLFLSRNTFRTPGYWNFDAGILKNFKLPREGMGIQFRAELFNVFNHSNLYADPNTNLLTSGQVLARRGVPPGHELYGTVYDRRNIQLGLKFTF